MNKNNTNLNLARKWRPKTFNNVVGQNIPIKTLQNGLYLKKFFPVYLFAGQRGCGKTSTARIFAAAVNCQNLKNFQDNPKEQIPCLKCKSCMAMQQNNHPDFIEIDAASHTGVDNVRQILQNCTYMPLSGNKKIYLIDEAHMLSKAAFNAFLKILEEPPNTVLFILATTEVHKIPQTVLSRCFQVIFRPIDNDSLKKHLTELSHKEEIKIDAAAIEMIIEETEGSARDAINLLERVRFSDEKITQETIFKVLGKLSEKDFYTIIEGLIDQDITKLLNILESINFQSLSPQIFWNTLVQTFRHLMWAKYGTNLKNRNIETLKRLAEKCSVNRIHAIFQLLWNQEPIFLQTAQKHIFLESTLIQICEQTNIKDLKNLMSFCRETNTSSPQIKSQETHTNINTTTSHQSQTANINSAQQNPAQNKNTTNTINTNNSPWNTFLQKIVSLSDQMLESILKQARFVSSDTDNKLICIQLSNNSQFFKDKIKESEKTWLKTFHEVFPKFNGFKFVESTQNNQTPKTLPPRPTAPNPTNLPATIPQKQFQQIPFQSSNQGIDISDKDKWPKTNLIIKHFPGKIKLSK